MIRKDKPDDVEVGQWRTDLRVLLDEVDAMFTPEEVERIEDEYDHRVQVAVDLIWLGFVAGVVLGIVIGLVIGLGRAVDAIR